MTERLHLHVEAVEKQEVYSEDEGVKSGGSERVSLVVWERASMLRKSNKHGKETQQWVTANGDGRRGSELLGASLCRAAMHRAGSPRWPKCT